jgi:hypothetical protein
MRKKAAQRTYNPTIESVTLTKINSPDTYRGMILGEEDDTSLYSEQGYLQCSIIQIHDGLAP